MEPSPTVRPAHAIVPLGRSALVLLCVQEEHRIGGLPLEGLEAAVAAIVGLLAAARWQRVPVVHVVQLGRAEGPFAPGGAGARIMPEVVPRRGETLIGKRLPDAFVGTDLDVVLRRIARDQVVVAGFTTHASVGATVSAALALDHVAAVAADAVATRDLPDPLHPGRTLTAADVHVATLAALADRRAAITTSSRLV